MHIYHTCGCELFKRGLQVGKKQLEAPEQIHGGHQIGKTQVVHGKSRLITNVHQAFLLHQQTSCLFVWHLCAE